MLALFKEGVVDAPKELHSSAAAEGQGNVKAKNYDQTIQEFLAANPNNGVTIRLADKAIFGYAPPQPAILANKRLFCSIDNVYCLFVGSLDNLSTLNKQYGLQKVDNEAMFLTEAYRTLRDRSPMPAYRVLKELEGSFGFVIYDCKEGTVFAALGADKAVNLFWGVGADGSVMISDNVGLVKVTCKKSFAPFPPGCLYHSERGLMSFEHPMYRMKAMPRVDSEGAMCGCYFAVDTYSKVSSMPRVGSSTNWATWE